MAIDWPDWSQQVAGGLRSVGNTPASSGSVPAILDVVPTTFERAVMIHTPLDITGVWTIQVIGLTTGRVSTLVTGIGMDDWVVAYVNASYDASWRIEATNAGATPLACEVFLDTQLPLVRVANVKRQEVPGRTLHRAVDLRGTSLQGAGTLASVTLGPSGYFRLQLAYLDASLTQQAGAAGDIGVFIRDGLSGSGPIMWAVKLSVTAAVGVTDRLHLVDMPLLSSSGGVLTCEFQAPYAGAVQWISAGVWTVQE